ARRRDQHSCHQILGRLVEHATPGRVGAPSRRLAYRYQLSRAAHRHARCLHAPFHHVAACSYAQRDHAATHSHDADDAGRSRGRIEDAAWSLCRVHSERLRCCGGDCCGPHCLDRARPAPLAAHVRAGRNERHEPTLGTGHRGAAVSTTQETAAETAGAKDAARPAAISRLILLVPLLAFLALAALFFLRLGSGDPSRIPSALIGRPAPQVALPALPGLERDGVPVPGLDTASFKANVTVVNVWA